MRAEDALGAHLLVWLLTLYLLVHGEVAFRTQLCGLAAHAVAQRTKVAFGTQLAFGQPMSLLETHTGDALGAHLLVAPLTVYLSANSEDAFGTHLPVRPGIAARGQPKVAFRTQLFVFAHRV